MEVNRGPTVIQLSDPSHVGEARRMAARMGEDLALDEKRINAIALVTTELATNIIKHAGEGLILAQALNRDGHVGLQLLAIDKGPGIANVAEALSDGFTTTSTLGGGFGVMRRSSDLFDIYTAPKLGTCVVCEFWQDGKNPASAADVALGIISTPVAGETVNGDGWTFSRSGGRLIFMLVDGLGHGILASEAAREAEKIVLGNSSNSPATVLQDCHDGLAKTRGAAMAIAALDMEGGVLRYAGAGNISGSVSTAEASRGLASHNGTLGHVIERIQEFSYPWEGESTLILHSDGVSNRWNLNNYPGLRLRHPSLIAAVLYRDFRRSRDDATVLVARNRAA